MKDQPATDWARAVYNTFAKVRSFLPPTISPLKCIGDEVMYFIPEPLMTSGASTRLQRFAELCSIAREPDPLFKRVKVVVAYCTNAYPLTFLKGTPDVYGKDIDLSARLRSKATEGELVMNEPFVQEARTEYAGIGNKEQFAR